VKDCPVTVNPLRLLDARLRLGVSQWTMARLIGLDDGTLEQWEQTRGLVRTIGPLARAANAIIEAAALAGNPGRLGQAVTRAVIDQGAMAGLYLVLHTKHWQLAPQKRRPSGRHPSPTKTMLES